MLADMIIYGNTTKQQNNETRQINEAMRQITNVIEKTAKKGRFQNIAKYYRI